MTIPVFEDLSIARRTILRRVPFDEIDVPVSLLNAIEERFGARLTPAEAVDRILRDVRERGDDALRDWAQRLDNYAGPLAVAPEHCAAALATLDPALREAINLAITGLTRFINARCAPRGSSSMPKVRLGRSSHRCDGSASMFLVALRRFHRPSCMPQFPARVAGVEEIIVCTPPQRNGKVDPTVLAAAAAAGVSRVFAIGGAQAIAAMAYGTASVPRVDKIVVLAICSWCWQSVPSTAWLESSRSPVPPRRWSSPTLMPIRAWSPPICWHRRNMCLRPPFCLRLIGRSPRRFRRKLPDNSNCFRHRTPPLAAAAMTGRGGVVLVPDLDTAFDIANEYAPEHLCLLIDDPWRHVGKVRNAGGVFLGERSFEVLGDYVAGPSHIMPTGGTARFASRSMWTIFVK
jgi:histidinol dehydrogenase